MTFASMSACAPDLGPRSAQAHADACVDCHPTHGTELAGSRHADAASSELFVALRERAEAELGAGGFCDRCHLAFDEDPCLTCHAAVDHVEPANGLLIADPTGPVRGPWGAPGGPHASATGLISESALCGTCHDQDGVAGFSEHPFATWTESSFAADGVRCQDCHMSAVPGVPGRPELPVAEGGSARPHASHAFTGLSGDGGDALLRAGLTLTGTSGGARLENHAGHTLPDGASFLRELWVEGRAQGVWTGDRHPLHAELRAGGVPTWDPVAADQTVLRGLGPGEVREIPMPAGVDEVCVRFRPVGQALSEGLGLPVPDLREVVCAPRP